MQTLRDDHLGALSRWYVPHIPERDRGLLKLPELSDTVQPLILFLMTPNETVGPGDGSVEPCPSDLS